MEHFTDMFDLSTGHHTMVHSSTNKDTFEKIMLIIVTESTHFQSDDHTNDDDG